MLLRNAFGSMGLFPVQALPDTLFVPCLPALCCTLPTTSLLLTYPGSIIYGGGQVVLPMLYNDVVQQTCDPGTGVCSDSPNTWVTSKQFYAGEGGGGHWSARGLA
jgi:hypothetical protein